MDPSPIYVSSPGVIVDTSPPYSRLVYATPTSTIGRQTVVRDGTGQANPNKPIIVSTTNGAIFRDGLSTLYVAEPYGFVSYAALTPNLMMPLYASSIQTRTIYGTESNFTPSEQYTSTSYNPLFFNATSSTQITGKLINAAPLFTTSPLQDFKPNTLSTTYISTATVSTLNLYTISTQTSASTVADYISSGYARYSTVQVEAATFTSNVANNSSLTTNTLTIGGNWSLRGTATVADLSGSGYFSTIGADPTGIGADLSGASWITVGGPVSTGSAPVVVAGAAFVSSSIVYDISTLRGSGSNVVFESLAVGKDSAAAAPYSLDISGRMFASLQTVASGFSTINTSTSGATTSTLSLFNINDGALNKVYVDSGKLYINSNQVGAGVDAVVSVETLTANTLVASTIINTVSTLTSSFIVGSNLVNSTFNLVVYGTAQFSTARSTLLVACGFAETAATPNTSLKWSWDGLNWSNAASGGNLAMNDVAWNGRMWVAVGSSMSSNVSERSTIQWSLDGSNWSNVQTGGFQINTTSGQVKYGGTGISWNGRMWIATGACSNSTDYRCTIQYSVDGSNFTNIVSATGFASGGTNYGSNITIKPAWNGRYWLAGRTVETSQTTNACFSFDGVNWSVMPITMGSNPYWCSALGWNGRYWLAGSYQGAAWAYSQSNFNSIGSAVIGAGPVIDLMWDGMRWFRTSDSNTGALKFSYNGLANWYDVAGLQFASGSITGGFLRLGINDAGLFYGARKVIYTGSKYYCTGAVGNITNSNNYTIMNSADGVNWTPAQSGGFAAAEAAVIEAGTATPICFSIASQSNVADTINAPNFEIIPTGVQTTYYSTAQIYSLSSMITFNQTLFVDSQNAVGINSYYSSISSAYTLYIDGSMFTYGAAKASGSSTWTSISDQRIKANIEDADIGVCYDLIRSTHVHYFQFKADKAEQLGLPTGPRYGVYAQEMEKVFPSSVVTVDGFSDALDTYTNEPILDEQGNPVFETLYDEYEKDENGVAATYTRQAYRTVLTKAGSPLKMFDPSQLNLVHYGASTYLYSTIGCNKSTIQGRDTYLTAPARETMLQDISGQFYTAYSGNQTLAANLDMLFNAYNSYDPGF